VANAINTMIVRGAPAIGLAAAYGVVLSAQSHLPHANCLETLKHAVLGDIQTLGSTRPTAVNLFWALQEMKICLTKVHAVETLFESLLKKALTLHQQDIETNLAIGQLGASLLPKGAKILTHCNAGAIATGGHGTALGIIRSAFAQDPELKVFADETRPRLQGGQLTVWELMQDGIPVTLIADSMSGLLMQQGKVDAVIVGADRIAANGDTANKIGTYNLALVAKAHQVPFYVAAPWSTFDLTLAQGKAIPIEERPSNELTHVSGHLITGPDVVVWNPAFDVTPANLITAIVTERGMINPVAKHNIERLACVKAV
jgi:methylthioribose-1-phosphate isomerase